MRRATVTATCAACAAVLAACGGSGDPAGMEGASRAPASTAIFVSIDTDTDGAQWEAAGDLLDKFPGGNLLVQEALSSLRDENIDFERDVKPALGPETDVVVLDLGEDGRGPTAVVLTQPDDEARLKELVASGDDPGVYEMLEGDWAVLGETQSDIESFKRAAEGGSLADSDRFRDAVDGISEDALATLYVNGDALEDTEFGNMFGAGGGLGDCANAGAQSFAGALRAEEDGVRLEGASVLAEDQGLETYEARLPSELPAGALAFMSFNNLADPIRTFLRCAGDANPDFDRGLAQIELGLGVSLEDDVLPLLEGEGALAAYPPGEGGSGQPLPTISLMLDIENEAAALETLDRIVERGAAFAGGQVTVENAEVDGVDARRVSFGDDFGVLYAVLDGKLVVTTSDSGLTSLAAEGDRLADDAGFVAAAESVGSPEETSGFLYVDIEAAADYALGFAEDAGEKVPPQVRDNVEPLRSLFLHSDRDGDRQTFEGFLSID